MSSNWSSYFIAEAEGLPDAARQRKKNQKAYAQTVVLLKQANFAIRKALAYCVPFTCADKSHAVKRLHSTHNERRYLKCHLPRATFHHHALLAFLHLYKFATVILLLLFVLAVIESEQAPHGSLLLNGFH